MPAHLPSAPESQLMSPPRLPPHPTPHTHPTHHAQPVHPHLPGPLHLLLWNLWLQGGAGDWCAPRSLLPHEPLNWHWDLKFAGCHQRKQRMSGTSACWPPFPPSEPAICLTRPLFYRCTPTSCPASRSRPCRPLCGPAWRRLVSVGWASSECCVVCCGWWVGGWESRRHGAQEAVRQSGTRSCGGSLWRRYRSS